MRTITLRILNRTTKRIDTVRVPYRSTQLADPRPQDFQVIAVVFDGSPNLTPAELALAECDQDEGHAC